MLLFARSHLGVVNFYDAYVMYVTVLEEGCRTLAFKPKFVTEKSPVVLYCGGLDARAGARDGCQVH